VVIRSIQVFFIALLIFLFGIILFLFLITRDIDKSEVVLAQGESWFNDWFTVTKIDERTYAIGEPRYWQRNYNYLIIGTRRAILFDSGPGLKDIRKVSASLTDLPLTAVSSHPHYDHIGNNYLFDKVASLDDPSIRSEVDSDVFQPSYSRGFTTRKIPSFKITEWWKNEQEVDLGDRYLKVLHVPGHESGSIALLDSDNKQLFTGDFIYPGWLVGFAPTSDIADYLDSVHYLMSHTSGEETLYGAHSVPQHPSPELPYSALADFAQTIDSILSGNAQATSKFPIRTYPVNQDMEFYLPAF